jgi:chemotaxis protein MotB
VSDDSRMFESGDFVLKNEKIKTVLKSMISELNKTKFLINIQGHTDSDLSGKISNMDLSHKRALSFAEFFISNGLDKDKLSVSAYGSQRPVADNDTPKGKALNRRVEVNIIINHSKFK